MQCLEAASCALAWQQRRGLEEPLQEVLLATTALIYTRPSCCTAGLIIVAISNFLFILFTGAHDLNQKTNNIQSPDIKGVDV